MQIRVVAFCLLSFAPLAWAECSRDDVQFYLSKGFTTEQVTLLCSNQEGEEKKQYRAYTDEYVDQHNREYEARMRVEREIALRTAIEGTDIRLQQGHLHYTRQQCVSEGVEKDHIFGLKSCPHIRYRIKLAGLLIDSKEYKKRLLFGQRRIRVEGEIERALLPDAFSNIPDKYWQDVLRKKLETGDETKIPLREGVDFYFARSALEEMVTFETGRAQRLADLKGETGGESALGDLGEVLEKGLEGEHAGQLDERGNRADEENQLDDAPH